MTLIHFHLLYCLHLDHLLPLITKMINSSLKSGRFPDEWKNALAHPLLEKPGLELVGLRGSALQWFRSYLRGRSQQVTINSALSKTFGVECGVPQVSCLGPLRFTIYASKTFQYY